MAQFTVNPQRFDPYKNFKFRVKWDGKYVAGISKVSALKRTTEVIEHREGDDPSTSRKSPGRTKYEPITLERGVTQDTEFEEWANKVWQLGAGPGAEVSLKDFRKDITMDNLLSLTSFTAAGYQSSKHCRISMATLAFWRSNASPWRMRAGSAIRAFRNRSSQPSKAEAQPSALWTKRRLCLEATGLSRTADERQQAGERKRGGLGFDRPPFPAAVVCRGIGPEMVRK